MFQCSWKSFLVTEVHVVEDVEDFASQTIYFALLQAKRTYAEAITEISTLAQLPFSGKALR